MSHHNTKFWVAVFCLGLINARPSLGVEYTLQAYGAIREDYTSNILLLPDALSPQGVWGSEVDVQTNFSAQTPTWVARGGARFDNWFYYPLGGLDMQNQYLDGSYFYLTERSRWGITGSYISDALLSSRADPSIGIVIGRIRRDLATITPSWNYQLNEYTGVGFSYSYNNSTYPVSSESQGALYPNSNSNTISGTINHQATEKLSLNSALSGSTFTTDSFATTNSFVYQAVPTQFSTPFGDFTANVLRQIPVTYHTSSTREINYLNLTIGLIYKPYDDMEIGFSGGGQLSQTTTDTTIYKVPAAFIAASNSREKVTNPVKLGPLFDISIIKKFDKTSVALAYGHQITPSLNGQLFTTNHVDLNANHQISHLFNGGLRLSYNNNSIPYLGGTPVNQHFVQVGADISYTLIKNFSVYASYNYQFRTLSGGYYTNTPYDGSQDNHNVSVSLRYDFDQLHY